MDPLVRSRRGANNQGEPVATGSQLEREYAAALSQADPGREFQGAVGLTVAGEASPGTMEQGGAEPLPLLTASPFHSQRIHEEVASGSGVGPRVARVEATDSGLGMSQGAMAVGESGPFAPAAASGLDVKSGQESGLLLN